MPHSTQQVLQALVTQPADTLLGFSGSISFEGTGSTTQAIDTTSIVIAEVYLASEAVTQGASSVAIVSDEVYQVNASISEAAPVVSLSANEGFSVSGSDTQAISTVSGVGVEGFSASGAVTQALDTASLTGIFTLAPVFATLAITEPAPIVAITGWFGQGIAINGAITEPAPVVSGQGGITYTVSTGNATQAPPVVYIVEQEVFAAFVAVTEYPSISGQGSQSFSGSGTVSVQDAVNINIAEVFTGSGALTQAAPSFSSTESEYFIATAILVEHPTISGQGAMSFSGSGAVTAEYPVVNINISEVYSGTFAPLIEPANENASIQAVEVFSASISIVSSNLVDIEVTDLFDFHSTAGFREPKRLLYLTESREVRPDFDDNRTLVLPVQASDYPSKPQVLKLPFEERTIKLARLTEDVIKPIEYRRLAA